MEGGSRIKILLLRNEYGFQDREEERIKCIQQEAKKKCCTLLVLLFLSIQR